MRAFLDAHERGLAAGVVPSAGFLLEDRAAPQGLDLARNLVSERAADAGDGVEVFDFDLGAEFFRSDRANRDIHIAAELAFFHVGVADAAVDHHLLENGEVGEGFFGRGDVSLSHDLHERRAGAVEVDAGGGFHVETFRDILLEVDADEAGFFVFGCDGFLGVLRVGEIVERDGTAEAERQIVLADLVVLRHVRVEIIFAVELADRADLAAEHEAGEGGELQRLLVHHGQCAGHSEADGADIGIRLGAVFDRAGAEHFAAGLELDMHFEADGGDVFGHGFLVGGLGFCFFGAARSRAFSRSSSITSFWRAGSVAAFMSVRLCSSTM